MSASIYVLYHADCADGFAAAWVCWLKFGDAATYIAVKYGEPLPELRSGSVVYIVDFSYDSETLRELAVRSKRVHVIDHHKTAQAELEKLINDGCDHRFFKIFDLARSGSVLTWMELFPERPVPGLLKYVQDRDLWLWKEPESKEINAGLATYPRCFKLWTKLASSGGNEILAGDGEVALRMIQNIAYSQAKNAVLGKVPGCESLVPVLNVTAFISETCHEMLALFPEAEFVASWYERGDGKRVWSLRSRKQDGSEGLSCDVSVIAKHQGGGGHPCAAGFEEPGVDVERLIQERDELLDALLAANADMERMDWLESCFSSEQWLAAHKDEAIDLTRHGIDRAMTWNGTNGIHPIPMPAKTRGENGNEGGAA